MLGNYPIDVVLLAMDLAAAKDFYADKIGLRVLSETPGGVTFQCGSDSHLVVTKSSVGTKDEQTQASFRVADVRAEVAELRRRGVQIEDYDTPGLLTHDGIADIGFAWMAWFIDPGKNCVGMMQLKNP
jgi:catechol 2,3-dioxygenase-like lactoylglutathione lyase family enzyme